MSENVKIEPLEIMRCLSCGAYPERFQEGESCWNCGERMTTTLYVPAAERDALKEAGEGLADVVRFVGGDPQAALAAWKEAAGDS